MWCLFKLCIQRLIQLVIIVLVTNKSGHFKPDQSFQEAWLKLVPANDCKKLLKGFPFYGVMLTYADSALLAS